ncbi:MAG TPA: formate dehydrogenase accessory sulfurtransferase FdhD [Pseudoxanthomonas sp.]
MVDAEISPSPLLPGCTERRIVRWRGEAGESMIDRIAEEVPIAMHYNDRSFAVMMATPCDLEDFALGFSLSEGLIKTPDQLLGVEARERMEGIELAMTVPADAPAAHLERNAERLLPGRGSCGICGTRELEDVVRQPDPIREGKHFASSALKRALAELHSHQPMNTATGSTHAAAWAHADGRIVLVREDVGRHNALDKLTGAMRRAGESAEDGMLLISSRASYEMVTKAASAGIGLVAAISAPTALAIELARSAGVCLIGFARPDGYNIYTHPERLHTRN